MKNSNETIGNRTRDLPTCSALPQPTALPRTTLAHIILCFYIIIHYIIIIIVGLLHSINTIEYTDMEPTK